MLDKLKDKLGVKYEKPVEVVDNRFKKSKCCNSLICITPYPHNIRYCGKCLYLLSKDCSRSNPYQKIGEYLNKEQSKQIKEIKEQILKEDNENVDIPF